MLPLVQFSVCHIHDWMRVASGIHTHSQNWREPHLQADLLLPLSSIGLLRRGGGSLSRCARRLSRLLRCTSVRKLPATAGQRPNSCRVRVIEVFMASQSTMTAYRPQGHPARM